MKHAHVQVDTLRSSAPIVELSFLEADARPLHVDRASLPLVGFIVVENFFEELKANVGN